ncbi:hypothetical protein JCM10207_001094 [Rhodosporidiobolus poonsookiae]
MRRFPAPPSAGGPSTPMASRSAEAPMQYEWEKPRQFPASPFAAVQGEGEGAERARKRAHYEAMDVDTPPRPGASFPPSATQTANPFGFHSTPPSGSSTVPPPHPPLFDANEFHPEQAFGLEDEAAANEISMVDEADLPSEPEKEDDRENLAVAVSGARRRSSRKASGGRKTSTSSRRAAPSTDDEGSADESRAGGGGADDSGFLGVLKSKMGRGAGDNRFSFQVHHHHAPGGMGMAPQQQGEQAAPEKWLRSGTPYILLGYLQFGSLALLAVLILSLLVLFLVTLYTDIQARLASLTVELRAEIIQCAKAYVDNRCAPETRIPAMESRCAGWEECMNREVVVVGKTRVVAETLAEVVNGFVDVISFKTMLFVLLTLGITIYGSSVALSVLSSRPSAPPPHSPSAASAPHFTGHAPHHLGLGYGAPPGYPPYGLPYGAAAGSWVVENGRQGQEQGVKEGMRVGSA